MGSGVILDVLKYFPLEILAIAELSSKHYDNALILFFLNTPKNTCALIHFDHRVK